jgi:polyhydroxybutyrate depolymerase
MRAVRIAQCVFVAALPVLFGRNLFQSAPAPRAAGPHTSGTCETPAPGPEGRSNLALRSGLGVTVITPTDYRAERRYGLLVLYPPAGFSRPASERFYDLTGEATAAGFIVAMSDPIPLSARAIHLQSEVAGEVRRRWCIDPHRVVFAGHSDGGSISQGTLLRGGPDALRPTAVIASGAGIRAEDLVAESCPPPVAITVLHSVRDERFPGYGEGVARWWARCFACEALPASAALGTCVEARHCTPGSSVRLCRGGEAHSQRPQGFTEQLLRVLR